MYSVYFLTTLVHETYKTIELDRVNLSFNCGALTKKINVSYKPQIIRKIFN